jgi:hypothetical protein
MDYLYLSDLAEELSTLEGDGANVALCEEDAARLEVLRDLQRQLFTDSLAEYAENEATMIPEEEFEDYAQEFAYDVGFASRADENPLHSFIDWAGWAESLKTDYSEVTFGGATYLIRAY